MCLVSHERKPWCFSKPASSSTFHPLICSLLILLMPQMLWRSQTRNNPDCMNHWIPLLFQLEGAAHVLCHLEFFTMNIILTNSISPFSTRASCKECFPSCETNTRDSDVKNCWGWAQVSTSPVSRWMLLSIQRCLGLCGGESS